METFAQAMVLMMVVRAILTFADLMSALTRTGTPTQTPETVTIERCFGLFLLTMLYASLAIWGFIELLEIA